MSSTFNREIAAELHITAKTAATHVEHILTKLGPGADPRSRPGWAVSVPGEPATSSATSVGSAISATSAQRWSSSSKLATERNEPAVVAAPVAAMLPACCASLTAGEPSDTPEVSSLRSSLSR